MLASPYSALMDVAARPEQIFVEGRGSWLIDSHGKRYLDFIQGWAVNCLGHCPPAVTKALIFQAAKLISCSPAFYNEPMIRLAGLLTQHSGLDRVFFANSGGEANEGAIKLARKWGALHRRGAHEIVTLHNAFHGRTLATMAASGKPQWEALFEPKVPGFRKVPINDLAAVEAAIDGSVVAVMLEPIQGEAGVIRATDDYLCGLRELTQRHGILLILDEIQTGIGRTGKLFGFQYASIAPDIVTLAKGLGAGVPLAALLARDEVCCFAHGDQGGSFNGNPLMTAVGCAVIEEVTKPGFLDHVIAAGEQLTHGLMALSRKHKFGEVRGRGLLLALELKNPIAAQIVSAARDAGLLINAPRPGCLRFMPALNVSFTEIDAMLRILGAVCRRAC